MLHQLESKQTVRRTNWIDFFEEHVGCWSRKIDTQFYYYSVTSLFCVGVVYGEPRQSRNSSVEVQLRLGCIHKLEDFVRVTGIIILLSASNILN